MIPAILSVIVHLAVPIAAAVYLARALRTGGPRRLWIRAGAMLLGLVVLTLWTPRLILLSLGPRAMSGIDTWALPVAVFVIAGLLQLLVRARVPPAVQVIVTSLAGIVTILTGSWEA